MKKRKNSKIIYIKENVFIIKDYITINICNKDYNLKYRTRCYKRFDTNKHSVSKVRKHGYQTMMHKGEYYALSRVYNISPEKRCEIINKILSLNIDDQKMVDHINCLWELNCNKSQSNRLVEFDTQILSSLSDYFIAGNEEDDILDEFRWERIRKYECPFEIKPNSDKKKVRYRITNKTFKTECKKQFSNWKKSISRKYHTVVAKFIDLNSEYQSKWCYVNQDNDFEFLDNTYKISDKLKEYKIKSDDSISMFKILAASQNDNFYFFDEKFCHIDNKFIEKIG